MKKVFCLLFATFIIMYSSFAVDNTYDVTFSTGYVKLNNNNKVDFSSEYDLFSLGAGLDLFWNPVPVGFYARIEPLVLSKYDRTYKEKSEMGLKAQGDMDISLVEELGAIYSLELSDYFYLDFAGALSFITTMAGNKTSEKDRVRYDSNLGLGFTADTNVKFVYNKFIAMAGIKASLYPALDTTCIDSKYSYDTFEESTLGYAIRPYIAFGFRIRHIKVN